MVTQSLDVGDRLTAGGEDGGHIDQHLPAVVDRYEPAAFQRHRQRCSQTHLVCEQTHRRSPGQRNHAGPVRGDRQPLRPANRLHLGSAPRFASNKTLDKPHSPKSGALSHDQHSARRTMITNDPG